MPTNKPIEPSDAWEIVLRNNGELMECVGRYNFLRGWIEGQSDPEQLAKEAVTVKRPFWRGLF